MTVPDDRADMTMVDQETIDRVAAAIDSADIGHSMTLIRLVDGIHTYRLEIDGKVEEFIDNDDSDALDQAYARIRAVKHRKQAEAVVAALVTRDILCERERCAKIAENATIKVSMHWDGDEEEPRAQAIAHRDLIAAAIRSTTPPSSSTKAGEVETPSPQAHVVGSKPPARKRVKLPPIGDELYEHYAVMSAQTHEALVKDYARKAVALATASEVEG